MVTKIALKVCPVDGCPIISSSVSICPSHGEPMRREIFQRLSASKPPREDNPLDMRDVLKTLFGNVSGYSG